MLKNTVPRNDCESAERSADMVADAHTYDATNRKVRQMIFIL